MTNNRYCHTCGAHLTCPRCGGTGRVAPSPTTIRAKWCCGTLRYSHWCPVCGKTLRATTITLKDELCLACNGSGRVAFHVCGRGLAVHP